MSFSQLQQISRWVGCGCHASDSLQVTRYQGAFPLSLPGRLLFACPRPTNRLTMLHCTTSEVDSVRRLPPLGSIQAFVQVARLGSLKAAADALALSSPALTRRIQSLEQFVGSPLFSRHHNVVELNERGLAFLDEIGPHLDAIATAVERVSEDQ